jgi:hypothetical protein
MAIIKGPVKVKKLLIITAIFFTVNFTFAQNVKELNEKYYLDLDKFEEGFDVLELREYINIEMKKNVEKAFQKESYNFYTNEYQKTAFESKIFEPNEGSYLLVNTYQKFQFNIDEKGQFTGIANFERIKRENTTYWTFNFINGKVKEVEIKKNPFNKPITKIKVNDSLLIFNYFDEMNQRLKGKKVMKIGGGFYNSVVTEYYDNGNIEFEEDRIKKINVRFYENGKKKSYYNSSNKESIDYDERGRKTEHSYPTKDNGWCSDYFENGHITKSNCNNANFSKKTEYYYKKGKLNHYEISENGEIRKFNKNNKLISKKKEIYIQDIQVQDKDVGG